MDAKQPKMDAKQSMMDAKHPKGEGKFRWTVAVFISLLLINTVQSCAPIYYAFPEAEEREVL